MDQLGAAAMAALTAFISQANFITRSNVAFKIERLRGGVRPETSG
jgi:hypothetical protein